MLRPILISCILSILLFTGCEESPTSVQTSDAVYTTFGGSFDDEGTAVTQTPDGGYLIVGSSYGATTLSDMYVIKTNSLGVEVSDSIFTAITGDIVTSFDLISDVKVLADGGYILVGSKFSSTGTNYDVWLVKLDADLNVVFTKTYNNGGGDDFGYSVSLCDDNGFIIAGKTYETGGYDMWVLKTTAAGVLFADADADASTGFGTGGAIEIGSNDANDAAYSVHQTDDGGYIVAGETQSFGSGGSDMMLVKLTAIGSHVAGFGDTDLNGTADSVEGTVIGGPLNESAKFVQETSDNNFIIVGDSYSYGSGQSDIYIVEVNSSGVIVWDSFVGGTRNDFANCVKQTADGGFVIVGNTYSTSSDVLVVKIFPNSQGEVEWQSTFGGDFDDVGSYISQTNDGGYILTGSTYTADNMNQVLLMKLDASGSQEF
jgi:hypothetical protein